MENIKRTKKKINKEYFEYYAKYSLITSLDDKYKHLTKDESPDWQSKKLDIGLEVTRAIDKDIYLAYNIINEYFGNVFISNHIAEKIQLLREKYEENNNNNDNNDFAYGDISNIDNLKKQYLHKTIKLNKNYIHYKENQLYMFTFKSMDENEVKQCFDIDLSIYKCNFDICYVNCFDRLYICDFVNKKILHSITVETQKLHIIKEKALDKSKLKEY